MNTRTNVKRILVYGDSLVYGKKPRLNEQWPANVRFTGVIQEQLGDSYDIIEEGLRGRTLQGENGFFTERDGLAQFGPIIGSHLPLDLVLIMLGTNDCNLKGPADLSVSANSIKEYCSKLNYWSTFLDTGVPKLVFVGPPDINENNYDGHLLEIFSSGASQRLSRLRALISDTCQNLQVPYYDASVYCKPGSDGIHLDEKNNVALGKEIAKIILHTGP